jgi:phosphoribosylformylglycinamidine cyclo-ligase
VEKDNILKNETITAGDIVLGLPSSGVHTNGYSLVRKIFGTQRITLETYYRELNRTLGEELLEPHRCYYKEIKPLLPLIKGLAHITGSGLVGNIPRILPDNVNVHLYKKAWTIPEIFRIIQHQGKVDEREMYHVFNMGIGMTIVSSQENATQIQKQLPEAMEIGEVVLRSDDRRLVIE